MQGSCLLDRLGSKVLMMAINGQSTACYFVGKKNAEMSFCYNLARFYVTAVINMYYNKPGVQLQARPADNVYPNTLRSPGNLLYKVRLAMHCYITPLLTSRQ